MPRAYGIQTVSRRRKSEGLISTHRRCRISVLQGSERETGTNDSRLKQGPGYTVDGRIMAQSGGGLPAFGSSSSSVFSSLNR